MDQTLYYGRTLLHNAAEEFDLAGAASLLKQGATVDARDEFGNTPLLRAVFSSKGRGEMIALLRRHGADPLAANYSSITPVSLARDFGHSVARYFDDVPESPAHPPPVSRPSLHPGETILVPEGNYKWDKEHNRLFLLLVPVSGQAPTVQGELVRAVMKLTDEAYRNGNGNWDQGFERLAKFVDRTLNDTEVFSQEHRASISLAVRKVIDDHDNPNLDGNGSPLYALCEFAVKWCFAHPKLIAHAPDPKLKR